MYNKMPVSMQPVFICTAVVLSTKALPWKRQTHAAIFVFAGLLLKVKFRWNTPAHVHILRGQGQSSVRVILEYRHDFVVKNENESTQLKYKDAMEY